MMGLQFVGNRRASAPRTVKSKLTARTVKLHLNKNENPVIISKKSKAAQSSTGINGVAM